MKPVMIAEALRIERLGSLGEGLAVWQDRRVAVPYTLPGELVSVRHAGREPDQIFARLDQVLEPAAERVAPACRHFGTCGGCALQHLEASRYRAWKVGRLTEALAYYGIVPETVEPLIESPPRSRRRAVLSARNTLRNGLRFGFNEKKAHWIVDLEECPVLLPEIERLIMAFRPVLAEVLAPGDKLDIFVNALDHGLDVLLLGEFELTLARREKLAALAQDLALVRLSGKSRKYGASPVVVLRPATCRFGAYDVPIAPGAFLQATLAGERAMAEIVTAALARYAKPGAPVADLFAGYGTLGVPQLAAHPVHAVESDKSALAGLQAVTRMPAPGHRLTVAERNLFDDPLTVSELEGYGAVIVDPPRAGAAAQTATLAQSPVPLIVYISCNPQSFSRDARALLDVGYRLASVTPIDQFLWSHHLEVSGVFVR